MGKKIGKNLKIEYPEMLYSILLLIALCLIGGGSKIVSLIVLTGFVPLILKPEYLIGPVFFSSIWSGYILVGDGQSLARYLSLFFIFGVFAKSILHKIKIKVDFWFLTSVLGVLLAVILSSFGIYSYTSIPVSFVLNMLLFLVTLYCPIRSKEVVTKQLWFASVLSVIYACWFLLKNGLDAFEGGKIGTLEEGVNSNNFGQGLSLLAIVIFAHLLLKRFKGKVWHISLMLISVFLIFLTGSRTALIALIISAVFILLFWMRLNSRKIGISFVIIVVALALLWYIYDYLLEVLPELMGRFSFEDIMEDGGSGRIDVWSAYFKIYFPKYWLFGMGFDPNNLFYAIEAANGVGHGAHNIIVDILASSGVVGLVLYMSMYMKGISSGMKFAKKDMNALLPLGILIAYLSCGIGENVLRGRMAWFAIALILLLKKSYDNENKCNSMESIKW